ncbi:WD repeat-containing protein WRAP73 isoform X3 [Homo sapiens]|uniref:WD repeat-containing protein WRAP73 isoform X3 n=1 Tax=Homo sapiens TaxID=9606 RepID=UPI000040D235|nr:WD repeat-containing protein WRAP73 isoform X3 [Homo sapiens]XP_054192797.1 WD repeat-containing protein WRAP73 isoform X3 [Homo sapiens]
MNFSEVFKLSSLLCKFSPDGKYLASCVQYRLVVRDVNTLQILQLYTCLDQIQHIEWSADSLFILCAMYKRGLVQVWSLEQPEWHCKIDEGSAGLVASCWSPDGRHILNTTEFHLRITVWSLCTKSVSYIKYPKACLQGITFTRDGRYMALAERRDCKDYVSIFVCSDWQLLRHFDTDTQDLTGIEWAPNGCVLAVWDTCLEVRILNHVTWKMITEFGHPAAINDPKIVVYKEAEKSPQLGLGCLSFPPPRAGAGPLPSSESKFSLQTLKPVTDRANPKIGIGMLAFSPDSYFLATRNDNIPNAVWVWDIQKLRLFAVLEQLSPVRAFQWDPQQPRLAICTGGSRLYLWSPAGCMSVQVPGEGDFAVLSLCWHLSGDSMALLSKDHFCLCFLETEAVVGTACRQLGGHT